jgi:hypothetical protein
VPVIATSTIQPDQGRRNPTVSLMAGNGLMKFYMSDECRKLVLNNDSLASHFSRRVGWLRLRRGQQGQQDQWGQQGQ